MTIKFYEYGNDVMFNKRDIETEPAFWEEEISVGDDVLYHDSKNGTRPLGHVVSISTYREYLLVRLASYELFVILRKVPKNDYIVIKSNIQKVIETTGRRYYAGDASLVNVHWELDPERGEHLVMIWYLNDEHRLTADIIDLEDYNHDSAQGEEGELVAHVSGRYELSDS